MLYFTFLLVIGATIEGPDAGEAADMLAVTLGQQATLRSSDGAAVGYLHEVEAHPRWWTARPVEIETLRRQQ